MRIYLIKLSNGHKRWMTQDGLARLETEYTKILQKAYEIYSPEAIKYVEQTLKIQILAEKTFLNS